MDDMTTDYDYDAHAATYDVGLPQRRCGNREHHEKFKIELKYRRRQPAEDIQSLAQEVESLVNRAYPRAPADMRETFKH